jgi:hypothetical protein
MGWNNHQNRKLVGLVIGKQMVHSHSPTYADSWQLKI